MWLVGICKQKSDWLYVHDRSLPDEIGTWTLGVYWTNICGSPAPPHSLLLFYTYTVYTNVLLLVPEWLRQGQAWTCSIQLSVIQVPHSWTTTCIVVAMHSGLFRLLCMKKIDVSPFYLDLSPLWSKILTILLGLLCLSGPSLLLRCNVVSASLWALWVALSNCSSNWQIDSLTMFAAQISPFVFCFLVHLEDQPFSNDVWKQSQYPAVAGGWKIFQPIRNH